MPSTACAPLLPNILSSRMSPPAYTLVKPFSWQYAVTLTNPLSSTCAAIAGSVRSSLNNPVLGVAPTHRYTLPAWNTLPLSVLYSRSMSSNAITRSFKCTSTPSCSMRFMIFACAFGTRGNKTEPLCTKTTLLPG